MIFGKIHPFNCFCFFPRLFRVSRCYCRGQFAWSCHTRPAVDASNSDLYFEQLWLKCGKKAFKMLEFSEIFHWLKKLSWWPVWYELVIKVEERFELFWLLSVRGENCWKLCVSVGNKSWSSFGELVFPCSRREQRFISSEPSEISSRKLSFHFLGNVFNHLPGQKFELEVPA